ncbi:MAG: efflux RND transporter periplasmic adaptor subunit [Spirochaetales bacterium]|nr:efflux RND transporter periplasmic adaptor subunit [Spirochaetales bacterium]
MKKKSLLFAVGGILIVGAIVVGGFLKGRSSEVEIPHVQYTQAALETLEETVSGSGIFASRETASIRSKIVGRVTEVAVDDGQWVDTGDILLNLDSESYSNALERAQVAYETTRRQTQTQLFSLRSDYMRAVDTAQRAEEAAKRTESLFHSGSVSQESWDKASDELERTRLALEVARQKANLAMGQSLNGNPGEDINIYLNAVETSPEVMRAKLAVQAAERELADCTIRAPHSGYVTYLTLNPGDNVTADLTLCRIESLDEMEAEISIDEVDIGKISLGDEVRITTDSLIGIELKGRVRSISPVVQKVGNLRAAKVKATIDQEGHVLRAGASCLVKIDVSTTVPELVIPIDAFYSYGGSIWAYRLVDQDAGNEEDKGQDPENAEKDLDEPSEVDQDVSEEDFDDQNLKKLQKVQIELGRSSLDMAVVIEGLDAGDLIVSGNLGALRDGLMVTADDGSSEDA